MVISHPPEMTYETLEKIVLALPEPFSMSITLYGGFDYSDIKKQVGEILPDIEMTLSNNLTFRIFHPAKEIVLETYRIAKEHKDIEGYEGGRIDLSQIFWMLEDGNIRVKLKPQSLNVISFLSYVNEPQYIRHLVSDVQREIDVKISYK